MPQEEEKRRTVTLPTPLLESQPTLLCDGGSGSPSDDSKCAVIESPLLLQLQPPPRVDIIVPQDGSSGDAAAAFGNRNVVPAAAALANFRQQQQQRQLQQQQQQQQHYEIGLQHTAVNGADGVSSVSPVLYGELIVLGYNGCLPTGDRGRKRSKFPLHQRTAANGVKPIRTHHIVNNGRDQKVVHDKDHNTVSYTLSRHESVIVEYAPDPSTDMFQVGRASDDSIDCVVVDTVAGAGGCSPGGVAPVQSTISRFACRIIVERAPPHRARLFAAGFDSKKNIMLGEKATKWYRNGEIDGLTTNGIQLMHPLGELSNGGAPGLWREVSVGGGIYALRGTRSVPNASAQLVETGGVTGEGNVLRDGTLIDLCGATLLWRSEAGLKSTLSAESLENEIERLNACRPQCPVGLNTLAFARKRGHRGSLAGGSAGSIGGPSMSAANGVSLRTMSTAAAGDGEAQPYVYISCGHVHGAHRWGAPPSTASPTSSGHQRSQASSAARVCPLCMKSGPFVPVQVGNEPGVYVDSGSPTTHCFVPCAHMASEKTVKYWASVAIPYGCQGFRAMCPFCATPLSGDVGYVPLIFQNMDT